MNDDIDNEEIIKNVKYYCGDSKMSAHKVEYWSKNYYLSLKHYNKIRIKSLKRRSFEKITKNCPCYSWIITFSKLKEQQKKGRKVSALFFMNQENKSWIDQFKDTPKYKDTTFKA